MAKPDTTWKHDRALFLAERPKDVTKLPTFRAEIDGLHPYRLITVHWNRERCLHCPKALHSGQEAALDIDTTVLCPSCAKAHIEEILNPPKKAKPKPATKARKGKRAQPTTDEQMYLAYLESIMPELHPYYDAPDRVDLDRPADPPEPDHPSQST